MMRERVLSYPLAGPELRVDEGAEESDSALFSRHERIQLGNGEFTMVEILPGHHLLLLIDILILCDSP